MTHVTMNDLDGNAFRCTETQREALESLSVARAGGIATVYGYSPSTDYVTRPVQDIQLLTRFSTKRLYERKLAALLDITFSAVKANVANDPILSALSDDAALELFSARKGMLVESLSKSIEGTDRSDAHRQGHDRCYARVADGVRVHFVTEKDSDGIMQPVLTDGLPTVASIMLNALFLNVETRVKGEKKVKKSGAPVLMGNAIENLLNQKSVGFRALSLKEDNFDRVVVSRKSYLPEEVSGIPTDILNG